MTSLEVGGFLIGLGIGCYVGSNLYNKYFRNDKLDDLVGQVKDAKVVTKEAEVKYEQSKKSFHDRASVTKPNDPKPGA